MADCSRGDIPDDIYNAKDRGCTIDFLPVPDINGNVPSITGIRPDQTYFGTIIPSQCGIAELWLAYPGATFEMKNVTYSDEFMSWKTELFTVGESPVSPSRMQMVYYAKTTDRICGNIGSLWGNTALFTPVLTEMNPFAGTRPKYGYFGSTFQIFFNIYKIYCCIYDELGNFIDFNEYYYYSITQNSSITGYSVLDYGGPIDFCSPFSLGINGQIIGIMI